MLAIYASLQFSSSISVVLRDISLENTPCAYSEVRTNFSYEVLVSKYLVGFLALPNVYRTLILQTLI